VQQFSCAVCRQLLFFDNSTCLGCGSALGYFPQDQVLTALAAVDGGFERSDGQPGVHQHCANKLVARCNWMIPANEASGLCVSCRLTTFRPNDNEVDSLPAFADAESAKRRLIHQLIRLGLPVLDRATAGADGVAFELLSSRGQSVVTGHEAGVITLDLSESDDAHREFVRQQLGEPYRTVLGHLRHEIGHYYWPSIVERDGDVDAFRALFGDERVSYEDALDQHYSGGEVNWKNTHVSQYATMHPWEDWAETFAHYLHIDSGLETADSIGLAVGEPARSVGRAAWTSTEPVAITEMMRSWLGLTFGLNAMSRSIGQADLYPFVLSPVVVDKLDFVHRCVTAATAVSGRAG